MSTSATHRPSRFHGLAAVIVPLVCAVLLSLMTVFNQVKTLGLSWHEEHYRGRLNDVKARNADSPWQYRPLSDTAVAKLCNAVEAWAASYNGDGDPGPFDVLRRRPVGALFVFIRVAQNTLIFLLALAYFRRFGIDAYLGLVGISALAWAMSHANQDSDLAINTYTEVIFYLLAGIAILSERPVWVLPIALLAALNRETSGLIPVMLFASTVRLTPSLKLSRPIVRLSAFSMGLYWGIFIGLRQYYGDRGWEIHPSGAQQGMDLFLYNIGLADTWANLAGTLGLLPVLGLILWRAWPRRLKAFFWAIVPVWFPVHFLFGAMAETRLVLVPLAVVFLPGALIALRDCAAVCGETREVEA